MAERRKVLAVHAGGGIGGAPLSLVQLMARLPLAEFDPVLAFTEAGGMARLASERGVRALVVRAPAAFFYSAHARLGVRALGRFLLYFRSSVLAAERLLEAERPDLLHLNTSVLLPFGLAAERWGVPVVWHVREVLGSNPWLRRWHAQFICRRSRLVIATSNAVRSCLPCSDRVEVVPNAVDLDQFSLAVLEQRDAIRRELNVPPSARVVAILGSVQRVKGHWLLLDAVERARRAAADLRVLVVAGGMAEEYRRSWKGRVKGALGLPMDNLDRLRRDAAKRDLNRALHYTGFRTDVPRLLAASDLLVFPSLEPEGFGRPLIEAMAMARPVVAANVGPTREILPPEYDDLLVPPGDADALAEAIVRVVSDVELAEQLGRRGRATVERHFALPAHVERMLTIYRSALERRVAHDSQSVASPSLSS